MKQTFTFTFKLVGSDNLPAVSPNEAQEKMIQLFETSFDLLPQWSLQDLRCTSATVETVE